MKSTFINLIISAVILITTGDSAHAQNTNLTGEIKDLTKDITITYNDKGERKSDKVTPVNGKFTWTAPMPEPQKITITFPGRLIWIYAEKGNMTITGSADALGDLKITGSKTQALLDQYNKDLKVYLADNPVSTALDQYARERSLRFTKSAFEDKFIKANPESIVSLNMLIDRAMLGSYEELHKTYDMFANNLRNLPEGKLLAERIAVLKRKVAGQPILDFTLNDIDGKALSISQYKGQYVFIDVWASWCGPCRKEMPNVRKAYDEYKDKGFRVIAMSIDQNVDAWKKAVKEDGMPFPQILDQTKKVADYYGIVGIPSNLLVDPNGKIVAIDLRGEMLHQKLAEVLGSKSK